MHCARHEEESCDIIERNGERNLVSLDILEPASRAREVYSINIWYMEVELGTGGTSGTYVMCSTLSR